MIIRLSEISMIKMSVKPPQSVVDADYCVIKDGTVHHYQRKDRRRKAKHSRLHGTGKRLQERIRQLHAGHERYDG